MHKREGKKTLHRYKNAQVGIQSAAYHSPQRPGGSPTDLLSHTSFPNFPRCSSLRWAWAAIAGHGCPFAVPVPLPSLSLCPPCPRGLQHPKHKQPTGLFIFFQFTIAHTAHHHANITQAKRACKNTEFLIFFFFTFISLYLVKISSKLTSQTWFMSSSCHRGSAASHKTPSQWVHCGTKEGPGTRPRLQLGCIYSAHSMQKFRFFIEMFMSLIQNNIKMLQR